MILTNENIASYHQVRNDIEDCLASGTTTTTEAKNKTRALMQMFATKGYSIHGGPKSGAKS